MTYGTMTDHYPATSKLLHWLVAVCVLTTAPVAIAMTRVSKGPTQDILYNFHKSLGVLILILMILRLMMHVDAALYHHFIRRDSVLKRMLPRALGGL